MALAGYIAAVSSGQSFSGYAQRHILDPLGMTSSTFSQPPPAGIARRTVSTRGAAAPFLNPYPAGSLVATPMDMARFIASQLGSPLDGAQPILPEATRISMLKQHFTPSPGMPGAAYGYFESDANGHPSLHHTGDGGDHSLIYLVPEARLGFYLVYTTPHHSGSSTPREQIAQDLIDHYLGCVQPFTQPPPPAGFASTATRYTGTYRIDTYSHDTVEKLAGLTQEITISNPGDGTLNAVLGGGHPIRLVETRPDLFRDPDGAYVAFQSDASGKITALSFSGAAVDDPGSAHLLRWWETAKTNLIFISASGLLLFVRAVSGLVMRWSRRRAVQPSQASIAWRVSGWIVMALVAAVLLAFVSLATAGGVITAIPTGLKIALLLINLAGVLCGMLVVATATELVHRRGRLRQRIFLGMFTAAAVVALPFLGYWNLLGLRY